eukprot:1778001-Prymnesium_polylepis.1
MRARRGRFRVRREVNTAQAREPWRRCRDRTSLDGTDWITAGPQQSCVALFSADVVTKPVRSRETSRRDV